MLEVITAFEQFPQTSNLSLSGPQRLTLQQFQELPVSGVQLARRDSIYQLEALINSLPQKIGPNDIEPVHHFCKGIYTRELTMPQGTIIVGKRHAQEHLVQILSGHCSVFTERGREDLEGPCMFKSPAGEKRVVIVHEETTWVTIHHTNAETLEDVEADLIIQERFPKSINSVIALRGKE